MISVKKNKLKGVGIFNNTVERPTVASHTKMVPAQIYKSAADRPLVQFIT